LAQTVTTLKNKILIFGIISAIALAFIYRNHFDNGFHFDDAHSLVNNAFIRDISNIPLFFKDPTTLTTLPANQSYRPLMPTLYAIDYQLAGQKMEPFQFHLTIFIFYLLQGIVLFFILKKLFQNVFKNHYSWFAFFGVVFYMFHTANAETINYISARSDLFSTFFGLISFWVFINYPDKRKYQLYLIPLLIGLLVKPAVLVFPAMFFFYVHLFEKKSSFNLFQAGVFKTIIQSLVVAMPSLLLCGAFYVFQAKMTPETFIPGTYSRLDYILVQPYVIFLYVFNFILPIHLSADSDLTVFESLANGKFWLGILFLAFLIYLAVICSKKEKLRLVSFGICWFLIALLPTSSIIPFAEVMNDHRTFFPYIGLIISLFGYLHYLYVNKPSFASKKIVLLGVFVIVIGAHTKGVHHRNEVWHDGVSLWKDVTENSPKNGRGQMNYGLALMQNGDYAGAEKYYRNAFNLIPYYSYLNVNMGVLKSVIGQIDSAEYYYQNAIKYGPENPEAYFYYGSFLMGKQQFDQAAEILKKCIALSSGHLDARHSLMEIYYETERWDELENMANQTLQNFPNDVITQNYLLWSKERISLFEMMEADLAKNPTADGYVDLSVKYYNKGKYEKCIDAAKTAISLNANYAQAYNNICSAYNKLGEWDKAIEACNKAIEINPSFEVAIGNKNNVEQRKYFEATALSEIEKNPTAENYLNASLTYYQLRLFDKSILYAQKALEINPNSVEAYNNICSAYNELKQWDKAIEACGKALEINPNFELAKNNLNWAVSQKALTN